MRVRVRLRVWVRGGVRVRRRVWVRVRVRVSVRVRARFQEPTLGPWKESPFLQHDRSWESFSDENIFGERGRYFA